NSSPRVSRPTEEPSAWDRQSELLWRYLRDLPILRFTTPPDQLLSARRLGVAGFATAQETFHRRFAEQHHRAKDWLVNISAPAFFVTLCVVILQLVLAYTGKGGERVTKTLMMVTLVCAGGAFVVSLLAHQLGFEAIAERSTNAAERYRNLLAAID